MGGDVQTGPERVVRAVEVLEPAPGERILEVGCGPGVAAALICERLGHGHLTAIDRSSTAIARTAKRNAAALAAGTLDLRQVELARLALADTEGFDAVLAVNVNLFWTGRADAELRVVKRALRPGGRFVLAYETPSGTVPDRARQTIQRGFDAHGLASRTIVVPPVLAFLAER
jgi:SAM-dependent methyltransferase